jgi:two-component system sensor histidine kinase VanS
MKTMLEVAQADPSHQDVPQLVKRLAETNQRGIDIVEALLSLTALHNRSVELEPVDLAAVVRAVLVTSPGVTLTSAVESVVEGNEVLLHQVVTNLVQNAVRHGGGTVEVRVTPGQLVVRNDGRQLDPTQVQTFTEPFAKARHGTGHGLGLALVSRIVEVHHGTLTLTANRTGGLTATVALPLADLEAESG